MVRYDFLEIIKSFVKKERDMESFRQFVFAFRKDFIKLKKNFSLQLLLNANEIENSQSDKKEY